jgi:hypothetical protein
MYNQNVSTLQLYTPPAGRLTGLVESNKLYNAFMAEPTKMRAVMARAFGQMKGKEDVLDMLTNGAMQTEVIETEVYRWPLYTKDSELVEVAGPNLDGGVTPGINKSTFRVPFAERFFELGANLRADDNTMVRVQEDPYQDGNHWIYTLILTTDNYAAFMDPAMVTYGARFLQVWGDYEEYSEGGVGTMMSSPAMLENQLQIFRSEAKVSRIGARTKLAMDIMSTDPKSGKGKVATVWADEVVWKTYEQHRRGITWASVYSNRTSTITGANGRMVKRSAGFKEQISPANIWEYSGNELDYDLFVDFIENLEKVAIDNGGSPNLVCLTGRDGLAMIDRMLAKRFKDKGLITVDSHFIKGDGSGNLSLQGYFREFTTESGITVKFKNFPPYNDAEFNRQVNKVTGNPLEASTFTIMNFGTTAQGDANVKKVYFKGGEGLMWSVGGSMTPSGERKSKSSEGANGKDGYDVIFLDHCGLKVGDPTSCGELRQAGLKNY